MHRLAALVTSTLLLLVLVPVTATAAPRSEIRTSVLEVPAAGQATSTSLGTDTVTAPLVLGLDTVTVVVTGALIFLSLTALTYLVRRPRPTRATAIPGH